MTNNNRIKETIIEALIDYRKWFDEEEEHKLAPIDEAIEWIDNLKFTEMDEVVDEVLEECPSCHGDGYVMIDVELESGKEIEKPYKCKDDWHNEQGF